MGLELRSVPVCAQLGAVLEELGGLYTGAARPPPPLSPDEAHRLLELIGCKWEAAPSASGPERRR